MHMDDDEDDYYRNADPRDERRYGHVTQRGPHRSPRYPQGGHGTSQPMTHGTAYPMTHNTGVVPPGMYGGYPPPYGYPPYGYPPPSSSWNLKKIGRAIRVATPLLVSVLSLPQAPTPIPPSGDAPTDAKNAFLNQANAITYQTSLAQDVKRSELVFALGEGLGLALESFS